MSEIPVLKKPLNLDWEANRTKAQLMFQKALISKVVNAGIVSPMSYQTWKTLSEKSGGQFISRIPLLPEMEHPGEWLEFFRQPAPG